MRSFDFDNEKPKGLKPKLRLTRLAALLFLASGGILTFTFCSIGDNSNNNSPCRFIEFIFNPQPEILSIDMTQTAIPVAQTQTAMAGTPPSIIIVITATLNPQVTHTLVSTDTPVPIPSETLTPTGVSISSETSLRMALINELIAEPGKIISYSVTLQSNEAVVGNAQSLTVNGKLQSSRGCIVYSITGPGTYDISVQYGSIKRYINTSEGDVSQLFENERSKIITYSSADGIGGSCGSEYPIVEIKIP